VKKICRLFQWVLKGAVFFTLFAFALNNSEDVNLKFFFGTQWTGPMVLVVLAVFTLGLITGVIGMLPHWWKHKKELEKSRAELHQARHAQKPSPTTAPKPIPPTPLQSQTDLEGDIHGV
jgi:uncharacterized integral membrane protein